MAIIIFGIVLRLESSKLFWGSQFGKKITELELISMDIYSIWSFIEIIIIVLFNLIHFISVTEDSNTAMSFEVTLNMNNVAVGIWQRDLGRVEIIKMKGGFWRTCGFCIATKNYLQPEEALLLHEKAHLLIERDDCSRIPLATLYAEVIEQMDTACYLTYVKLRVRSTISDK